MPAARVINPPSSGPFGTAFPAQGGGFWLRAIEGFSPFRDGEAPLKAVMKGKDPRSSG